MLRSSGKAHGSDQARMHETAVLYDSTLYATLELVAVAFMNDHACHVNLLFHKN